MNQPEQHKGQLDRILAQEDALVPSSGFAASVMDAIQEQAAAPAPIPFPWKLALPGIAALVAALVIIVRLTVSALQNMGHNSGGASFLSQTNLDLVRSSFARVQAGPALLALAAALICTLICGRLGVRSTR
jgi:hypothetical protein